MKVIGEVRKLKDLTRKVYKNKDNIYGFVYITENIKTKSFYIGQKKINTSNNPWQTYLGSGVLLNKKIKEYGAENFRRKIIDIAYSGNELNEKEQYWIDHFKAVENRKFYNISYGTIQRAWLNNKNTLSVICVNNGAVFLTKKDAQKWLGETKRVFHESFGRSDTSRYICFRMLKPLLDNQKYCKLCIKRFKSIGKENVCEQCRVKENNFRVKSTPEWNHLCHQLESIEAIQKRAQYKIQWKELGKNFDSNEKRAEFLKLEYSSLLSMGHKDKFIRDSLGIRKIPNK